MACNILVAQSVREGYDVPFFASIHTSTRITLMFIKHVKSATTGIAPSVLHAFFCNHYFTNTLL